MSKFALGDVVALLTHPFTKSNTDVIISGEHLLTPPTMVVVEIISRIDTDDEKFNSYKCTWFSSKKNNFLDQWFNEDELRNLERQTKLSPDLSVGCLVALNNLDIELGKRRSYLQIDAQGSSEGKKTSSISAHLPFVSPIMLVMAIVDFDEKKLKKGTIVKDKIFPEQWVKCKYYNAFLEKYSEVMLPIETLMAVPEVSDDLLKKIQDMIKASEYMRFEDTISKPVNIFNKSGLYILSAFDLISQKYKDLEIHKLPFFTGLKKPYIEFAPMFKVEVVGDTRKLLVKTDVWTLIDELIKSEKRYYLLIRYIDNFGNITKRTVKDYQIVSGQNDLNPGETINYLNAYCNLRNDVRNFKVKSISEVSVLDIGF